MSVLPLWALRDVMRRPGEALLAGAALLTLAVVLATPLLLIESTARTSQRLIEAGPSVVLRRINAGGWAPMPEARALKAAQAVRGVSAARTRIWGTVASDDVGTVTLIGLDQRAADALGVPLPGAHTVHVGAGLPLVAGAPLTLYTLNGQPADLLTVAQRLPAAAGAAVDRAVLCNRATARHLLGLADGHATDLVIDVFHATEQAAILPDLVQALPFPVRATTQREAIGLYAARTARRGSLVALATLPALLALLVLVIGIARDRLGRRAEVGLLKAMGWTTGDVVGLHLWRALWVGAPAILLGLGLAYGLIRWPGVSWPGALFFGWSGTAPPLSLDADGALLVLAEVGALLAAPWLIASLWPALRAATADPADLLAEGDA
jgi:hypothetical protein